MSDVANSTRFHTLMRSEDLPADVVVPHYMSEQQRRVSIVRVDGHIHAFEDLCTCAEDACPLSGGLLAGTTIMCQCHGSHFDISNGTVIDGPATRPLGVYEVREADGNIEVQI